MMNSKAIQGRGIVQWIRRSTLFILGGSEVPTAFTQGFVGLLKWQTLSVMQLHRLENYHTEIEMKAKEWNNFT